MDANLKLAEDLTYRHAGLGLPKGQGDLLYRESTLAHPRVLLVPGKGRYWKTWLAVKTWIPPVQESGFRAQTKNNEIHHVVLDPVAKRTLIELRKQQLLTGIASEWVFCNDRGERFREIRNAWKTACKRAGLADKAGKPLYRIHDLRHTFASRLVMKGVPMFTVSHLLNHKTLGMVKRYAHLSPAYREHRDAFHIVRSTVTPRRRPSPPGHRDR